MQCVVKSRSSIFRCFKPKLGVPEATGTDPSIGRHAIPVLHSQAVYPTAAVHTPMQVEGIPWTCSEEDVREFFKGCGKITAVRMPRWQDSGRPRGYAHVAFAGSSGARAAFGLDGQYLKGRYLTIQVMAIVSMPTVVFYCLWQLKVILENRYLDASIRIFRG